MFQGAAIFFTERYQLLAAASYLSSMKSEPNIFVGKISSKFLLVSSFSANKSCDSVGKNHAPSPKGRPKLSGLFLHNNTKPATYCLFHQSDLDNLDPSCFRKNEKWKKRREIISVNSTFSFTVKPTWSVLMPKYEHHCSILPRKKVLYSFCQSWSERLCLSLWQSHAWYIQREPRPHRYQVSGKFMFDILPDHI